MMQQELNTAKDKDLITSLTAMKRAAVLARQQAVQTDTAIIQVKAQKIVRLTAAEIREEENKA